MSNLKPREEKVKVSRHDDIAKILDEMDITKYRVKKNDKD